MDAALKEVFALRKSCDLKLAALQNARASYLDFRKTSVAFGHSLLARGVWSTDEASSELCGAWG
jgi:regulator of sirC expression with transglutaminase-like and TPR domain